MDHHTVKPLVIILDIDGTVIGNISPQICLYDLKNAHVKINYSYKELFDRFDKGLLRPYFDTFIKNTQRRLPNVEFFIYTAADNSWGTFIANAIEKHCNIHFNRPILTRKHCFLTNNSILKSLKHITPMIKRTLQKKYGKNLDLTNRILMIDNSRVFQSTEHQHVLLCPSYNISIPENLPAYITEDVFNMHKNIIEDRLKKYIPSISIKSYLDFQKTFYTYYIMALNNSKPGEDKDRFWFFLNRLLEVKNIQLFTPRAVQYINSKLSKRLH